VIDPFVFQLAIFVLAIFVGYYVVWSVTPALHTPLMAVTNAISSVIVVGALLAVGISASGLATGFGFVALILASVNIFGGFLVTQRMLAMYKKKESEAAVMSVNIAAFLYLVSGVLFIMALRGLSHPTTSRKGNIYGMVGMGSPSSRRWRWPRRPSAVWC
jgi:NAD(P) transhydrogenase subunit alpha